VLVSLSEEGDLNVRDCTCVVVRDNKAVAKRRELIHYFDETADTLYAKLTKRNGDPA
jgi:hypothetical protein